MSGGHQNDVSKDLQDIILRYQNKNIFSAASVSWFGPGNNRKVDNGICCGTITGGQSDTVTPATLFDLASLTKPLVTLLCLLYLVDSKKLAWDDPLGSLLETTVPGALRGVKLYDLTNHSAGLAAHRDFWKNAIAGEQGVKLNDIVEEILKEKPTYKTGSRHLYSDLGYILLGFVVELKTGKKLNHFWSEIVAQPLGIEEELFYPGNEYRQPERKISSSRSFALTGWCRWSGEALEGVVHDDNCRSMGGIAGHAGLFGTGRAVLVLCKEMLALYRGEKSRLPISAKTFRFACQRSGDSEWATGFNLVSQSGSSAGRYFSTSSIGHLGFTGTSFWIDLSRELIVVLLTNRVLAGNDMKGIRALRPAVHDYLAGYLLQRPV